MVLPKFHGFLTIFVTFCICSCVYSDSCLLVNSPEFAKLFPEGANLERLARGFHFLEGPAWHKSGFLLFSDTPANAILKLENGINKATTLYEPSGNSNGLTYDPNGMLVVCEQGNRRVVKYDIDGKATVLASQYKGKRLNSPNDLVAASDGSIYFTDPAYGVRSQDRQLNFQGVFKITPKGKLTLSTADMKSPNGLALSSDEKTLYVVDSELKQILSFEIRTSGMLGKGKVLFAFSSGLKGSPDGMKVDKQGNLWVAGPGGVWVFSKTGVHLGIISLPETPSNCAWGDEDGKTLYITTRTSLYKIKTNAEGVRLWMVDKKPN